MYADDVFVLSIGKVGKLEFVKKIPKSQHAPNRLGQGLSINSKALGNDIHCFYIDSL